MRKGIVGVLVVLVIGVILPLGTNAATLSWTAPGTYTDGSNISTTDQGRITYTPYYGSSSTGPWTSGTSTLPGVTTSTLPDPAVGATRWYTVDATLDGMTSAKGTAVSKTVPFKVPGAPGTLTVQ